MSPPTERPDHTSNVRPPKRCDVSAWIRNGRDGSIRHRVQRSEDDYARTWKKLDDDARNAEATDSTQYFPSKSLFGGTSAALPLLVTACWFSPYSLLLTQTFAAAKRTADTRPDLATPARRLVTQTALGRAHPSSPQVSQQCQPRSRPTLNPSSCRRLTSTRAAPCQSATKQRASSCKVSTRGIALKLV